MSNSNCLNSSNKTKQTKIQIRFSQLSVVPSQHIIHNNRHTQQPHVQCLSIHRVFAVRLKQTEYQNFRKHNIFIWFLICDPSRTEKSPFRLFVSVGRFFFLLSIHRFGTSHWSASCVRRRSFSVFGWWALVFVWAFGALIEVGLGKRFTAKFHTILTQDDSFPSMELIGVGFRCVCGPP